jgi:hypothetical protein
MIEFFKNLAGTITNSYYDSTTSGQSDIGKGTPKTTTEMQQGQINDPTIYVNWLKNIWGSGLNTEYPSLAPFIKGLQYITD